MDGSANARNVKGFQFTEPSASASVDGRMMPSALSSDTPASTSSPMESALSSPPSTTLESTITTEPTTAAALTVAGPSPTPSALSSDTPAATPSPMESVLSSVQLSPSAAIESTITTEPTTAAALTAAGPSPTPSALTSETPAATSSPMESALSSPPSTTLESTITTEPTTAAALTAAGPSPTPSALSSDTPAATPSPMESVLSSVQLSPSAAIESTIITEPTTAAALTEAGPSTPSALTSETPAATSSPMESALSSPPSTTLESTITTEPTTAAALTAAGPSPTPSALSSDTPVSTSSALESALSSPPSTTLEYKTTSALTTIYAATTTITANPTSSDPSPTPTCDITASMATLTPSRFYNECCSSQECQLQIRSNNSVNQFCVLGDMYSKFANGNTTVTFVSTPAAVDMRGLASGMWMQNFNVCSWNGVVCDANKSIVSLTLKPTATNYAAGLPESISRLTSMSKLVVQNTVKFTNDSGGDSPSSLFTIPSLTDLQLLNVGWNIGAPTAAEGAGLRLDLRVLPNLNAALISYVTKMPMVYLNMVSVALTPTMFSMIYSSAVWATSMQRLYLWKCGLTGEIPSFAKFTSLAVLSLNSNGFGGTIPDSVCAISACGFVGNTATLIVPANCSCYT
ncbi:hypothetical protein SeLEV6574_g00672 [Synchytrium endobioticum]|uniref:Leucine-rich repeat-containing N-terminal plant-type domain-containing protein n=1 Tax=Synchytrium endobioticum TaxID=286115 RepID=A0A507DH35_9FUNG|nr:hypothetical protein SeLEV6574_g00672 [Synchytrium endobioticum]